MSAKPTIGVITLARPTFDVPYAEEMAGQAWSQLEALDATLIGSKDLLFDADAVQGMLDPLKQQNLDLLLILQVTFTDATMTVALAQAIDAPIAIWSFPEPRVGGRLRLNSLCGLNLAGHALAKAGKEYNYIHKASDNPEAGTEILSIAQAGIIVNRLKQTKLGVIGKHPDGFDTCSYDQDTVMKLCGVSVEQLDLSDMLKQAATVPEAETDQVYARVDQQVDNLAEMEQEPLRKSLKVYSTLRRIANEQGYNGLAVRCWPEFFTEYGCAACGPMAMMNQEQTPCGCEADVYGTMSTLILQWLGSEPAFMADLVDINTEEDTGVFWHCGLAPISMADPESPKRATVHTNRKKPLLYEFTLKPGRVTVARLSQAKNEPRLVIGSGEMVRAPMSFTGTSGVIRFDQPASDVLDMVMREGLEHHYSLAYGEHRPALRRLAQMLDIPVIEIT